MGTDRPWLLGRFLDVVLSPDPRPAWRRAAALVDEDVHADVAAGLAPRLALESRGTSGKNTACYYEGDLGDGRFLTVYLSTVLPYACCPVSTPGAGLLRFAMPTDDDLTGSVATSIRDAGFVVLSLDDVMRSTRLGHASEGRAYTVWEALFEQDLDPPWEWPG